MTLPSLINKAEKVILKNQFKKAYSTLSQALLKSEADLGYKPACHYQLRNISTSNINGNGEFTTAECQILQEEFLNNLNIVAKCEKNAYPTCIPKYAGLDTIKKQNNPELSDDEALEIIHGYSGFSQNNILNKNRAWVLENGIIIIDYSSSSFTTPRIFAVDINGKKGPNKWGHDLFSFWTASNDKTNLVLIGGNYDVEKGGKKTPQMIREMHKK